MASCSSWTGQKALHPLPRSKSLSGKRGVQQYTVPEQLTGTEGVAVYKVSKSGKLLPRRVTFSNDKRSLLVSTRRFKYGLQGLWNRAATSLSSKSRSFGNGSSNQQQSSSAADAGSGGNNSGGRRGGDASNTNAPSPAAGSGGAPVKVIPLEAIDRLQRGTTSRRFLLAKQDAKLEQQRHGHGAAGGASASSSSQNKLLSLLLDDEDCGGADRNNDNNDEQQQQQQQQNQQQPACFTIVYAVAGGGSSSSDYGGSDHQGGGNGVEQHYETLDLVVPKAADYDCLLTSLEDLVALREEERQRYCSSLQLLQYHWCVTLGKQIHQPLTLNEFLTLCEKLNVQTKRSVLSILFREDLTANDRKDDSLPLENVAHLLETIHKSTLPRENLFVEKLWQEIRETDPVPPINTTTTITTPNQQQQQPLRSKRNVDLNTSFEQDSTMANDNNNNERDTSMGRDAVGDDEEEGGLDDDNNNADDSLEVSLSNFEEEESISAVAFLSFLRSQQKEFQTTLEEATDLVRVLNHQVTPDDLITNNNNNKATTAKNSSSAGNNNNNRLVGSDGDRLAKSRFIAFLTSDANDLLHPTKGSTGSDDMTHPMSHYWINASHDTYMDKLPNSMNGKSAYHKVKKPTDLNAVNEQCYAAALLRGVRCLELDLWDGLDGREPVVAKCQPTVPADKRLSVTVVLQIVRQFLQQHPYTFPILLKIENHCSTVVQQRLAQLLYSYLGKDGYIASPSLQHYDLDAAVTLPSPEALRGKVVIIGKRPKKVIAGRQVRKDDYDVDNDRLTSPGAFDINGNSGSSNDEDDDKESYGIIVGFSARGPIRSHDADAIVRSPEELLVLAQEDSAKAQKAAQEAAAHATALEKEAQQQEQRATHYTQKSGLTRGEVQRRANLIARGLSPDEVNNVSGLQDTVEDEKSPKGDVSGEEGLEVHEVLPDFLEGNKEKYQNAANEAVECAGREAKALSALQEKEQALRMAKANLEMSREREGTVAENAKRAATEAREHFEHAESAKERVEQVRDLLKNSRDQSSSAGTVVQTALTEAKISEKRAADAEARAARAAQAVDKDRQRAEEATKTEELLEQEVNVLHDRCMEATDAAKAARERVEKAAAMLDRVNEQLRLIETSSQYRKETQEGARGSEATSITKHTSTTEEREMCRELIKEASEEHTAAESSRIRFQQQFEERAYQWKIQADVACQARRTADRSVHVAEELAEHAEEEREAANLRHVAHQRAEATVENSDSYRSSIEAQLAEAERAAAEAAYLAVKSRKRADHLAKEEERVKDHSRFEQILEKLEWERKEAQAEYDTARMEREEKDRIMSEEKRLLDTSAEICKSATREAAAVTDRVRVEHLYQQEAVSAYAEAVKARDSAKRALENSKSVTYKAEVKRLAAERALEYKKKMDLMVEIPVDLARITLIHTTKFQNWPKSLSLSNVQAHSFAQNILLRVVDKDPDNERRNLLAFTKNHLVRVFPSWKSLQNKTSVTNYDPVFAWALGCQLVASNFHSSDESLIIAEGRFRQNGSCGYVLKPAYLTDNVTKTENDQRWSFHILSGHHLPKPIRKAAGAVSPLIKISIYSGSAKETRISYRTRPARRAGLNPVWASNNKFEFVIPTPSISMVCFSVWHAMEDGTENFMAAAAFPASCLREGYRSIALFDENHSRAGAYTSSCLLVKATKR